MAVERLLLETGDFLLLETADRVLLESSTTTEPGPTFYAGGVGCECCGAETPCAACFPCSALTASNFCFCIIKLTLTQLAGDCASFDYTLDPPLCIVGLCNARDVTMVSPSTTVYKLPDGRELHILAFSGGNLHCDEFAGLQYWALEFSLTATLFGCGDPTFGETFINTVVDIDSTQGDADPCDYTTMVGLYTPNFLNLFYSLDVICSFSDGGCP